MIASMATVVLPVLRSPMISSRWPRPIGVIASIDLMPVCNGSCTGLRPMMPGAWISTRRSMRADDVALPSIGSPSALMTRPSIAVADRHAEDAAGGLHGLAFFDAIGVTEDDRADRLLVEVQGQTDGAVLELEQFVDAAVRAGR